jgi:hypothetical protein
LQRIIHGFGLILIVLGAFWGFTTVCTRIDFEKHHVKFCNNIFGILEIGKGIQLDAGLKLGIKKNDEVWSAFSRSNRPLDVAVTDYRIVLYDTNHQVIMSLIRLKTLAEAKESLTGLSSKFKLDIN